MRLTPEQAWKDALSCAERWEVDYDSRNGHNLLPTEEFGYLEQMLREDVEGDPMPVLLAGFAAGGLQRKLAIRGMQTLGPRARAGFDTLALDIPASATALLYVDEARALELLPQITPYAVERLRYLAANGRLPLEWFRKARTPEAIRVLAAAQRPEDAKLVLAFGYTPELIDWLGALEGSDRIHAQLKPPELFRLLRRRRCAGLSNRGIDHRRVTGDRVEETRTIGGIVLCDIAYEAGDLALVQHLPTPRFVSLAEAEAILQQRVTNGPDLRRWLPPSPSTYDAFADVLLQDPQNGYAAYRCAFVERRFGTPITAARVAWIRTLGFHDDAALKALV
jgi:hypothetical protein